VFFVFFKVQGLHDGAQEFLGKIFQEDKYHNFKKESFQAIQDCPIIVVEEFDNVKKILEEGGEYKDQTPVC
jgi:hypothetical protein